MPRLSRVQRAIEERQTASLYREAVALLKPYDRDIPNYWEAPYTGSHGHVQLGERDLEWLVENEKPLAIARDASTRSSRVLSGSGTAGLRLFHGILQRIRGLGSLLITAGRQREQQGDMAGALDDYLAALRMASQWSYDWTALCCTAEPSVLCALHAWSDQPTQTPELLRRAIDELAELDATRPPASDAIKWDYVWYRRLCSGDLAALDEFELSDRATRGLVLTSWLMPWELYRGRRLFDYWVHLELQ